MQNFASELRFHIARKGTIAQICKETGINRQQFNKYLSGHMLPGARNMRKICVYLGVSEEQLMSGRRYMPPLEVPATSDDPATLGTAFGCRPNDRPARLMPNGYYHCYFRLKADPRHLVCWLLAVEQGPHGQTFTCRTVVRRPGTRVVASRMKYQGTVFPGACDALLIGRTRLPLQQPGVVSVNTAPVVGLTHYAALALTRRLDGPLALVVTLHYLGRHCPARRALSGIGLVSLDDPSLDPEVARLMRMPPAAGANWIQSVNARNMRAASGGEESSDRTAELDPARRVSA